MRRAVPLPRNVVEIPLYVFLTWGVWPPIQLLLGVPYRDLDDRFSPRAPTIVAIDAGLKQRLQAEVPGVVADVPDLPNRPDGAQLVISSGRPSRRGPHRASGSMQSMVDIGINLPASALAWMFIWRDLGVVTGALGNTALRDATSSWRAALPSWQRSVRKQRQRILRAAGERGARPLAVMTTESSRTAAVVCARGAAARCGGQAASALIAAAMERYATVDAGLSSIELPAEDLYRYHHDVRALAPFFSAPGATHADYSGEVTHFMVPAAKDEDRETSLEVVL